MSPGSHVEKTAARQVPATAVDDRGPGERREIVHAGASKHAQLLGIVRRGRAAVHGGSGRPEGVYGQARGSADGLPQLKSEGAPRMGGFHAIFG